MKQAIYTKIPPEEYQWCPATNWILKIEQPGTNCPFSRFVEIKTTNVVPNHPLFLALGYLLHNVKDDHGRSGLFLYHCFFVRQSKLADDAWFFYRLWKSVEDSYQSRGGSLQIFAEIKKNKSKIPTIHEPFSQSEPSAESKKWAQNVIQHVKDHNKTYLAMPIRLDIPEEDILGAFLLAGGEIATQNIARDWSLCSFLPDGYIPRENQMAYEELIATPAQKAVPAVEVVTPAPKDLPAAPVSAVPTPQPQQTTVGHEHLMANSTGPRQIWTTLPTILQGKLLRIAVAAIVVLLMLLPYAFLHNLRKELESQKDESSKLQKELASQKQETAKLCSAYDEELSKLQKELESQKKMLAKLRSEYDEALSGLRKELESQKKRR